MRLKGHLSSMGVAFLFNIFGIAFGYEIFIPLGLYLIGLDLCIILYDYLKKKEIEKELIDISNQIEITKEYFHIIYPPIPRFQFELKIENKSKYDLQPKEGFVEIWHNNKKINTFNFHPDIKRLGGKHGVRDGLYIEKYHGTKDWRIYIIDTVDLSLQIMPTIELNVNIKLKTDIGDIDKSEHFDDFGLNERDERELFSKIKYYRGIKNEG